eukprot:gnl/MRDRNA2_/MRDRNA2_34368_c0_seq1.p1 gnl/MRDRNA2_/MRDRNA2_34368_c0~~gnl/MRDRNA2_/MRDRNA2_34368_c0_seq1.p1  ORF type:complete len:1173 (+),score=161.49 gnl/MRDRNA2_/MRDRNA2_34368_c0_seq1:138-3656(+)
MAVKLLVLFFTVPISSGRQVCMNMFGPKTRYNEIPIARKLPANTSWGFMNADMCNAGLMQPHGQHACGTCDDQSCTQPKLCPDNEDCENGLCQKPKSYCINDFGEQADLPRIQGAIQIGGTSTGVMRLNRCERGLVSQYGDYKCGVLNPSGQVEFCPGLDCLDGVCISTTSVTTTPGVQPGVRQIPSPTTSSTTITMRTSTTSSTTTTPHKGTWITFDLPQVNQSNCTSVCEIVGGSWVDNPAHVKTASCLCEGVSCTMPLENKAADWCWFLYEKGVRGSTQSRFSLIDGEWYHDNQSTKVAAGNWKEQCDPSILVCMGPLGDVVTKGGKGKQVDAVLEAIENGGIHPKAPINLATNTSATTTSAAASLPNWNSSRTTNASTGLPSSTLQENASETTVMPSLSTGLPNGTSQQNASATPVMPSLKNDSIAMTTMSSTTTISMQTSVVTTSQSPVSITSDILDVDTSPTQITKRISSTSTTKTSNLIETYLNVTGNVVQSAERSATVGGDVVQKSADMPDGTVYVAVQKLRSLNNSLSIQAGQASAVLPVEVATRVSENETILVKVLHHSSTTYLANSAEGATRDSSSAHLGCRPVQVEVASVGDDGELKAVKVNGLRNPIQIIIDIIEESRPNFDAELVCVWWDEEHRQWSRSGLTGGMKLHKGQEMQTQVACNSSHLTSFSALWVELQAAVQCSNLHILSTKAFRKYILDREEQWYLHPAGLLYSFLIFFTVALIGITGNWDRKALRKHHWHASHFILPPQGKREGVIGAAPVGINGQPAIALKGAGATMATDKDIENEAEETATNEVDGGRPRIDIKQMAANAVVLYVAHENIAATQKIEAWDIAVVAGKHVQKHGCHGGHLHPHIYTTGKQSSASFASTPTSVKSKASSSSTADQLAASTLRKKFQGMASKNFFSRTKALFRQRQPVTKLCNYSIVITHTLRALLYCNELWSSLLMAALFFSTTSTPADDPDICSQGTIRFARAIAVGLLSATLSYLIIAALSHLHTREFVYEADEEKKAAIIKKWRMLDGVLITLSVGYTAFCAIFVGLFVAQVSHLDRIIFLISIIGSLCQSWFFQPLMVAAVLSWLTTVISADKHLSKTMGLISGVEKEEEKEPGATDNWLPLWHGTLLRKATNEYTHKYQSKCPNQQHIDHQISRVLTLQIDTVD